MKIRSGRGILIYSAGQGLKVMDTLDDQHFMSLPRSGGGRINLTSVIPLSVFQSIGPSHFVALFMSLQLLLHFPS